MDYHCLGFRECASEVARYLVTIEGMDVQDPLRLRLMSHLQCYSAQRELAAKSAAAAAVATNPWSSGTTSATNNSINNNNTTSIVAPAAAALSSSTAHSMASQFHPSASNPNSGPPPASYSGQMLSEQNYHPLPYSHIPSEPSSFSSGIGSAMTSSSGVTPCNQRLSSGCSLPASGGQYSSTSTSFCSSYNSSFSPTGYNSNGGLNSSIGNLHGAPLAPAAQSLTAPTATTSSVPSSSMSAINSSSMRPYRPWGTELAY